MRRKHTNIWSRHQQNSWQMYIKSLVSVYMRQNGGTNNSSRKGKKKERGELYLFGLLNTQSVSRSHCLRLLIWHTLIPFGNPAPLDIWTASQLLLHIVRLLLPLTLDFWDLIPVQPGNEHPKKLNVDRERKLEVSVINAFRSGINLPLSVF